jgi:hypothetical protein
MVRTYLNGAQASLEKSVLDDYGIVCALIHENAHLWSRSQWAVPIRLVVRDDQAEQAARILNGDSEAAAQIEESLETATVSPDEQEPSELYSGNPWELLAIAALFLFPGLCVLQIKYPTVIPSTAWGSWVVARLWSMHFFGWLAVAFAASLIGAYFYLRRSSFAKTSPEM